MVVTWNSKCFSEESDLITTEILKELSCNSNLPFSLFSTLRDASHDRVNEKVKNFWIMKDFSSLSAYSSEHQVSLFVFERVMDSMLWHCFQAFNIIINLVDGCVWDRYHTFASHWVRKLQIIFSSSPFSVNQIHTFVSKRQVFWIKCGECFQVVGSLSSLDLHELRSESHNFCVKHLF